MYINYRYKLQPKNGKKSYKYVWKSFFTQTQQQKEKYNDSITNNNSTSVILQTLSINNSESAVSYRKVRS